MPRTPLTARVPIYRVALVRDGSVATETRTIRGPRDAAEILRPLVGDYDREALAVLLLDAKHRVIGVHIASVGCLDRTVAGPREIFRAAVLAVARAVIVGHNHPSGDPEPSRDDIAFTHILAQAGQLLDLPVLDHIVLGDGKCYVSLKERGVMPRA